METLTPRQQQILDLIRQHIYSRGIPPTRAEIAATLGFRSANAAEDHLRALARKGVIELTPHASRGIRIVPTPRTTDRIPVVGRVAAGSPILAEQHIDEYLDIGPDVFHPRADYLLRVRGVSMRDAGILDGDLLAVHRTSDVTSGQIVVARVNDEVTVKRFRRRGSHVHLVPDNPEFATILIDLNSQVLEIDGIVVGVIRSGQPL